MTRTSATGRADAASRRAALRKGRAGFTLVELLMTVAILGLAAGAVVLSMPDPRPAVGQEAERFAARLAAARDEAVLGNRPVAVEASTTGYVFSSFDGATWIPLRAGPFKDEAWQAGTAMSASVEPARVVFDPTGTADPVSLTLARDGGARTIAVDGAGQVSIND